MAASSRIIAYDAFRGHPGLVEIVGDRVFSASSVNKQSVKPLIAIRAHTDFPQGGAEQRSIGRREYIQVWAHDEPGDYLQIDQILVFCRQALEAVPHFDDFMSAEWIETGVDLRDDRMETITRYSRYQFTFSRREILL